MKRARSSGEDGYVMVLALVTLVVLALGLSVAAEQVQATRLLVNEIDQRTKNEFEFVSWRSRLTYALIKSEDTNVSQRDILFSDPRNAARLSTNNQVDIAGLTAQFRSQNTIAEALLAEPIPVAEGVTATILRDTGLIDVNAKNEAYLRLIADKFGGKRSGDLVAALKDFTDEDRTLSLGGAEQGAYPDDIRIPNAPLRHRDELCSVKGWQDTLPCQNARQRALFLTAGEGGAVVIENSAEELQTRLLGRLSGRNPAGDWMSLAQRERFVDFVLVGNGGSGRFRMVFDFADQPDMVGVATVRVLPNVSSVPFEVEETDILSIRG
ncbi:MAG: hypothetical protein AAF950_01255 [Pseudomonadota bacterium]